MPDNGGKYSLEELLRAKRQERPSPEFWASFERELKSKQRLLIQKQLVHETRRKSPTASPIFRFGALAATFGAAAVAVYFGLNTGNLSTTDVATAEKPASTPTFHVAASETKAATIQRPAGLQEFATLAQPARPRVVVQEIRPVVVAKKPTPSQISALETLAQLEKEIRASRASNPTPSAQVAFDFPGVNALFEDAELALANEEAPVSDIWNFEQAYLLGKYADPLGGTVSPNKDPLRNRSRGESMSFSQLDEILSSQGLRRADKSLDALTVRF